ncbi:ABC-type transport system involved in multi-copper enzyme maturation, permease component [Actinomyces bovis]|uniref:ABC-type transport system involved in multi-copper enzyme maturation, permease component n=1 Tax=Actinomyces bovis TaxID=1658 RepID=A0ABY1VM14_9ACTO|nr:ABC transporter permease subunit [Actinomyces bovis]SPT53149.1 ABC-type transport system involved in multi-copper enzyme maturation, permease component [Actinomyces bovis]VEG52321.1 ABC-type transport system involved in multi-copper enzyme maturation, permease component [Actinomyces israelii]
MTTSTASPVPVPSTKGSKGRLRIEGHQTFLRAVHAEWVKLRTLPSTWITAVIAVAITVLFGAGAAIGYGTSSEPELMRAAKHMIVAGSAFGQIVSAVLGALIITGEYSSGQIRSSLAAVPSRGRLLAAKTLVASFLAFVVGALSALLSWAVSAPFIKDNAGSLADLEYLGYVWGTGLSFVTITLMALGLGFLMRSTAGSITVVMVLMFVVIIPLAIMAEKWKWASNLPGLLPSKVAQAVADPFSLSHTWGGDGMSFLTHTQAVLVCVAWAVVPLLISWVVFRRRDA